MNKEIIFNPCVNVDCITYKGGEQLKEINDLTISIPWMFATHIEDMLSDGYDGGWESCVDTYSDDDLLIQTTCNFENRSGQRFKLTANICRDSHDVENVTLVIDGLDVTFKSFKIWSNGHDDAIFEAVVSTANNPNFSIEGFVEIRGASDE